MKSLRYPVLLLVLAVAAAGVVTRGCIASSVTSRRDSAAAPSRTRGPNRRLDKHHSEYYLTLDSRVLLNDERSMPLLGLGTFQLQPSQAYKAVLAALRYGYRHIDTAALYDNEEEIGRAIRDSGVPRSELWVTTKLWNTDHGYSSALAAAQQSLDRLGLEYVDLYLIHSPLATPHERAESWRALVELRRRGLARSIGVSNYGVKHLEELMKTSDIVPAVNQVELSPLHSRAQLVVFCESHGIAVEGYSPLTKAYRLSDPVFVDMAEVYGKTVPQILIRWALQHQFITIPRSGNPQHIKENADVFDFALSDADMALLNTLDEELTTGWDPTTAP